MTKCRFDIRELVLEKYPKRYRFSFSKTKDFCVCKKVKFVRFELKILFQDFLCKVPVDKQFELKCDPCGGIRHLLVRSSTDRTDHTVGGINSDQGLRSRL